MSIGTVINSSHPFAIAARLATLVPTTPYFVGRDLYPLDFSRILESHNHLILGDLPGPPEENDNSPKLRTWIENGGRLIYYVGWKDYRFLISAADIFGLEISPQPQIEAPPTKIFWENASNSFYRDLPVLRFLYTGRIRSGNVLASSADGKPAIIQNSIGNGVVITILGPISFPAGGNWILWKRFPEFVFHLLQIDLDQVLDSKSQKTKVEHPGFDTYTQIISMLIAGEYDHAGSKLLDELNMTKNNHPLLITEFCQVLRRIGKKTANVTAIIYSLYFLLDKWDYLLGRKYYATAPFQRHWIQMIHEIDKVLYINGPLTPRLNNAIEEAQLHVDKMDSRIPNTDREYINGYISFLRGLHRFSLSCEEMDNIRQVSDGIDEAIQYIEQTQYTPFTHPRQKIILAYLYLLRILLKGPISAQDPIFQTHILNLEDQIIRFENSLEDYDFLYDSRVFLQTLTLLASGDEATAWSRLSHIIEPFSKSVTMIVLRMRQVLQLDPLGFINPFNRIPQSHRIQIMNCLKDICYYRSESKPIVSNLIICDRLDRYEGLKIDKHADFSLLDTDASQKIALLSKYFDVLFCHPNGEVVGVLKVKKKVHQRNRIESVTESVLRQYLSKDSALITIAGGNSMIKIADGDNNEFNFSHGIWKYSESITIDFLKDHLSITKTRCKALINLLGDILEIEQTGNKDFHGGIIVILEKAMGEDNFIGNDLPPIKISSSSREKLLELLFSEDLSHFLDLTEKVFYKFGVRLSATDESHIKSLKLNPWLEHKGARHKSAVAFSFENKHIPVLIFSQDGGCLLAMSGNVRRLW